MKLQDGFPYSVEYGGRKYRLKPFYDNVLAALDLLGGNLPDITKIDLALFELIKGKYPLDAGLLTAVLETLKEENKGGGEKRTFDFVQDAGLIYAAFWQTYGLDLQKERGRLHWKAFLALFDGLPDNTRFAEVVKIRTMEMPKATKDNAKERAELARLKARYALHVSEEEREQNFQAGMARMVDALEKMATAK